GTCDPSLRLTAQRGRKAASRSLSAQQIRQDYLETATSTGGFLSPAEINGTGVRLRAYRPDDVEAVAAGYDDPLSHRFLPPLPSPFTLAHAERFLSEGIAFDHVVASRGQAEIGYWVGPWARGRGVATAAVRALSAHALGAGLRRLE